MKKKKTIYQLIGVDERYMKRMLYITIITCIAGLVIDNAVGMSFFWIAIPAIFVGWMVLIKQ
jgi:hypothetical protein